MKVGDWVYHDFELGQITEMEGERVVGFSTGIMSTAGNNLNAVPLAMPMKRIAEEFEFHSKRIHRDGSPGLNYPDIHRWLVTAWLEACEATDLKPHYDKLREFSQTVLRKQEIDSGYGFDLLRTRCG